jgi:hypothetical protein
LYDLNQDGKKAVSLDSISITDSVWLCNQLIEIDIFVWLCNYLIHISTSVWLFNQFIDIVIFIWFVSPLLFNYGADLLILLSSFEWVTILLRLSLSFSFDWIVILLTSSSSSTFSFFHWKRAETVKN